MVVTIYRREDRNTTPRGVGNPPTYHLEEPYSSDAKMIWVWSLDVTLPEGYTVAESEGGTLELYDANEKYAEIIDLCGQPAIITGENKPEYLILKNANKIKEPVL